jgi:hypothetical protein
VTVRVASTILTRCLRPHLVWISYLTITACKHTQALLNGEALTVRHIYSTYRPVSACPAHNALTVIYSAQPFQPLKTRAGPLFPSHQWYALNSSPQQIAGNITANQARGLRSIPGGRLLSVDSCQRSRAPGTPMMQSEPVTPYACSSFFSQCHMPAHTRRKTKLSRQWSAAATPASQFGVLLQSRLVDSDASVSWLSICSKCSVCGVRGLLVNVPPEVLLLFQIVSRCQQHL